MLRKSSIQPKATVAGRSLILNSVMVALTGICLVFVFLASLPAYSEQSIVFYILAFIFGAISIAGIMLFKGRLAISNFSRVIVGSVFIVSGLIKANDPIGFSYKLEEYFQDSALAFRIKDLFNMPDFSLEYLIPYALTIAILICILEILLGFMLVLGQKIKIVALLTFGMMFFFTFLTWHTANCSTSTKFLDKEYYSVNDPIGKEKIKLSKSNPDIKVLRQKDQFVLVETKNAQCVEDCGCFGDALKSNIGRSLTPTESFWKDLILLYLSVWILLGAFKRNRARETERRWFWMSSLVIISALSILISWFFPAFFSIIAFVGGLWFLRKENTSNTSALYLIGFITILSSLLVLFTLTYEPLKDYRPYSVGSNLKWKMSDGEEGVYTDFLVYQNIKSKETLEFDSRSKKYTSSKIWEDKKWKFVRSFQKTIRPTQLPSITDQFNPYVSVDHLTDAELSLDFVSKQLSTSESTFIRMYRKDDDTLTFSLENKQVDSLLLLNYKILDSIQIKNNEVQEIYIRKEILSKKAILILTVKNFNKLNHSEIEKYKVLFRKSKMDKVPMVMLTSANFEEIQNFRKKYKFEIPVFVNDEIELKTISRSNSSLLVLRFGVVKGKYPKRTVPNYEWLKSNVFI